MKKEALILAISVLAGLMLSNSGFTSNIIEDTFEGENDTEDYNIILVSAEPLRADHLPCYGYNRNTAPNICGLAEKGYLFENVYSSATWTLPAYTSLFTGKYPSEHGFYPRQTESFNNTEPLLVEKLRDKGYRTSAFVGNVPDRNLGHLRKEYNIDSGFETYESMNLHMDTSMPSALEWIAKNKNERFFTLIHSQDTHAPYNASKEEFRNYFVENYSGPLTEYKISREEGEKTVLDNIIVENNSYFLDFENETIELDDRDIEYIRARYDENILAIDYQVGELIEKLEEENIRNETVIIFTGAHGTVLGEKEDGNKVFFGQGVIDERVARVPVIINKPDGEKQSIEGLAQWFDLHPTILEIADDKNKSETYSRSLLNMVEDKSYAKRLLNIFKEETQREYVVTENKPFPEIVIRDKNWRYVLRQGGDRELYNMTSSEPTDVSHKFEDKINRFEGYFEEWRIRLHED